MIDASAGQGDSPAILGGTIPGFDGLAAFALHGAQPCELPVLLAVPHAGRAYPADVLSNMRQADTVKLRLEDRHADSLARLVARESGARLLIADAPRAMIDLNRAEDDIDWSMVADGPHVHAGQPLRPDARARSGLGLVPRRLPGLGEVWKHPLERSRLEARIDQIHRPWHQAIARNLAEMRDRWGAALLIDFHSMPPLPHQGGRRGAEVVLGDRFGATCHGHLIASAFAFLAGQGRLAAHNRPYAGGYALERHGAPQSGIHALQIEIDRSCYLDSRFDQPAESMAELAGILAGLIRCLGDEVATLVGGFSPQSWPQAAE